MVGDSWGAAARHVWRRLAEQWAIARAHIWPRRGHDGAGPDVVVIAKDGSIETTDVGTHGHPLRRALWRTGVWSRQVGLKGLVLRVSVIQACVFFSTLVAMALGYLSMDVGLVTSRSEGVKNAYMVYLFVFVFVPAYSFNEEGKTRPMLALFLFTITWMTFLAASHVGSEFLLSKYESVFAVGVIFFILWFVIALLSLAVPYRR